MYRQYPVLQYWRSWANRKEGLLVNFKKYTWWDRRDNTIDKIQYQTCFTVHHFLRIKRSDNIFFLLFPATVCIIHGSLNDIEDSLMHVSLVCNPHIHIYCNIPPDWLAINLYKQVRKIQIMILKYSSWIYHRTFDHCSSIHIVESSVPSDPVKILTDFDMTGRSTYWPIICKQYHALVFAE